MTTPNSSITTVTVATTLPHQPNLVVSASGSLMKNYLPALPIEPGDQINALSDSNGNPITISFGSTTGDFYAILNATNSPTGWSQVDLLPGVTSLGTPMYFTCGQLTDGNIFLFLASQDTSTGAINSYVAGPLSNNLSQTDFSQLAALWLPAGNPLPGSSVARAAISPVDDGQGYGIPLIAVGMSEAGSVSTYMMQCAVNTTTGSLTWNWLDFPSPTVDDTILDFAPGVISDLGQGMYMLYESSGELSLVFKTLLDQYGRDYVRPLAVAAGQNTLQSTAGSGGTSYLYAGGTAGVTFWDAAAQAQDSTAGATIASSSQIPGIGAGNLVVRQNFQNPNAISVWALSGSNLYMFNQLQYEDKLLWSTPLILKAGVEMIAPLINQVNRANELVFLNTNYESEKAIYYMWQDPTTTLWQEATIPLYNSDKVLEVSTYSTKLTFQLNGQAAASRMALEFSSATYQTLLINGLKYTVNPGATIAIQTDAVGELNVIQQIQDLAVSTFTLTGAAFAETLLISPASNVYKKLAAVQTGSDIPVLPTTLPPGVTADQIASAINQMMAFTPSEPFPTDVISIVGSTSSTAAKASTAMLTSETIERMPTRASFGFSFGPQGLTFHDGPQTAALRAGDEFDSVVGWVVDAVGDVVQFIGNVVGEIGSMVFDVAETVIKITLKVAGQVVKFVIQNFPQLFAFLTAMFKFLLVGLDKLIGWLGELFGWDDIWATHKVIATVVTAALDALALASQGDTANLKKSLALAITTEVGYSRKNFASMTVPPAVANMIPKQSASESQQANPTINMNTPVGGWSAYQVQYSGMLAGGGSPGDVPGPIQSFINDVLVPTFEVLATDLAQDLKNFEAIFSGQGATVQEFVTFLQGIADTVLDAVETVLLGCVEFLLDLIPWMVELLTEPVNMPFLSAFYTWLTDALGQGDTKSEPLTVVNLMSLLVAIPYTYVYKIANDGAAPFPPRTSNGSQAAFATTYPTDAASLMALPGLAYRSVVFDEGDPSQPSKGTVEYSIIGAGVASIAAYFGSLMTFIHLGLQEADAKGKIGKFLTGGMLCMGGIALGGSFPVKTPSNTGWPHGLRLAAWLVSGFRLASTVLPIKSVEARGAVKAGFDIGIGILALSSDLADDIQNGSATQVAWQTWCNDVCSNGGGIVAGLTVVAQPEVAIVGQGIAYLGGNLVGLITAMTTDVDDLEAVFMVNMGG